MALGDSRRAYASTLAKAWWPTPTLGKYTYAGSAEVPDAFPYLMMKFHAFADRKTDADKDLGRYHALDACTIVGMMTEAEYERGTQIAAEQSGDAHVKRAQDIVRDDFSEETRSGILRIREHRLCKPDFQNWTISPDPKGNLPHDTE